MARHRTPNGHGLGWNPSRPDQRDREFLPTMGRLDVANTEVALNLDGIPVLDQQNQGSCTGHGTAGVVMYDQKNQGEEVVVPARAMIYYNARRLEGSTTEDSGAQVRDAVKGVVKWGVVPDSEFPYDPDVWGKAPSSQDYTDAKKQEALVYEAVQYPHLNAAIASGFPFVFGFTVYESFEGDQSMSTGVVPIPRPDEQVLGGHCVWCWGFNSRYQPTSADKIPPRCKAIRNSWGEGVGDNGNFYLPQWYFDSGNASDFWVIRKIGAGS